MLVRNGWLLQAVGLLPEHGCVLLCLVLIFNGRSEPVCLMTGAGSRHPCASKRPPSGLQADGPIPGHRWCRTAAAPGNAFPGAEPGSGRQTLDTRVPLRSREGPGSRVQRASAHGLSPEADERVAGVRHGCGRSCSSHPCLRGVGAGGWGGRSCRVARRDCAVAVLPQAWDPGPPDLQAGAAAGHSVPGPVLQGRWPMGRAPHPCQELHESDWRMEVYCPEARC